MAKLSLITKTYILGSMAMGITLFLWFLKDLHNDSLSLLMLFILLILGSFTQIIKVEGTTNRSHYAVSFVIYAFTLFQLGLVEAMLVIIFSYFIEWLWRRPAWYISAFNTASLVIVANVAFFVYRWLNPENTLQSWLSVIAIIVSMIVFNLLNHLMVGIIVWMARGENFIQSGIFDIFPLVIDLTLLVMGGSFFLIWSFNPFAVILILTPVYLIYSTLRVPALERQTELDPKTGLYNHAYFMNQLENELNRAQRFDRPLSVMMADLDLLRNINNTYGHLAGDEVLQGIAKIMQTSVREYDVVARFGGEEFSVLMPETTASVAFERAEKIRRSIEAAEFTIATSIKPIKVTMSIGVSERFKLNQTKEEIIHNADTVLYHAKLKGRNRTYIYTDGMYESLFSEKINPSMADGEHLDQNGLAPLPARLINYDQNITRPQVASTGFESIHPIPGLPKPPNIPPSAEYTTPLKSSNNLGRIQKITWIFTLTLSVLAGLLFFYFHGPLEFSNNWGLSLFTLVLIFTEVNSTQIFARDTAVSTSAAPIVAGSLLFGPYGALALSIVFSITSYLKFKGPKNRLFFNAANQLIPTLTFLAILQYLRLPFNEISPLIQIIVTVICTAFVFIFTTMMVATGMSINNGKKISIIWWSEFSWLAPYHLVLGVMAYALIFGFAHAGVFGLIVILLPLMMLRLGQMQYLERTRSIVSELREKNFILERNSNEITSINEGLLKTLADLIDIRDPYIIGHSQQVTQYAVLLAEKLGFEEKRIQMIRNACLLHDLGKLGVSDSLLSKPDSLTDEEYQVMKNHTIMGANVLSKNPSLKSLIPIIRHHHEQYDGKGYPDGLKGNSIPIEARIVTVADAIDAMSSNRVYRKAMDCDAIISELKKNSGGQFDPQITAIAIDLLQRGRMILNNPNTPTQKP